MGKKGRHFWGRHFLLLNYSMRYLLIILSLLSFSFSSNCVELWGECYDIATTTKLDLSNNGLRGKIPPEIGKLRKLESLNLSHNRLTGEIPPEIGKLRKWEFGKLEVGNWESVAFPFPGGKWEMQHGKQIYENPFSVFQYSSEVLHMIQY